ncbi:MAG: hypothetical protein K2X06_08805 [Burkholderiales bacterium]|nr:hypothetical protein [Burkholderiales bacterium]
MRLHNRSRKLIYALGAVAGFLCATAYVLYAVFTSTSSTAAIGLLFVPVYGLLAAVIGWAVVYVGFSFADAITGRQSWRSGHLLAASMLLAIALLVISALLLLRDALAVARNPRATSEMLIEISQSWLPLGRRDVDVALLKNPAAPAVLLTAVVDAGDDNTLVSLAGAHANTPLASLEKIAAGPLSYDRVAGLAGNPRLTPAMARRLANVNRGLFPGDVEYRLYQTYVLAALARNPATPQDVFDRLAAREAPEYFLSVAVIYAPRASCAQIARAGQSGSEVLYSTAQSQLKKRGC